MRLQRSHIPMAGAVVQSVYGLGAAESCIDCVLGPDQSVRASNVLDKRARSPKGRTHHVSEYS